MNCKYFIDYWSQVTVLIALITVVLVIFSIYFLVTEIKEDTRDMKYFKRKN